MLVVEKTDDIPTCLALRRIVFIQEQNVSVTEEVDGQDETALHVLARLNGTAIGTARIIPYGTTVKIGRVCVLREHRGKNIGAALIAACHDIARTTGATRAILGAQSHALNFYQLLGYHAYGDVFDDAGIPHRMMEIHL